MKKYWSWFLGAFALVLGLFFVERNKKKILQVALDNSEGNAKDQLLKYQQGQTSSSIDVEKQKLEEIKKQQAQASQQNPTPEEIEQYWNKKKD
jgi:hypothetical protein